MAMVVIGRSEQSAEQSELFMQKGQRLGEQRRARQEAWEQSKRQQRERQREQWRSEEKREPRLWEEGSRREGESGLQRAEEALVNFERAWSGLESGRQAHTLPDDRPVTEDTGTEIPCPIFKEQPEARGPYCHQSFRYRAFR